MSQRSKYFNKLGIPPTSDLNEIKKAYRKKAMRYHPDVNSSENAQSQFIEITEAYEILTGQEKKVLPQERAKTAEEIKAEKIKAAKKRYKKMQDNEREKDALYYEKITSGWRWKVFKWASFYTLGFAFFLTLDFFLVGEQKAIPEVEVYSHMPKTITYGDELFEINEPKFWDGEFPPVRLNYSLFFDDLKSVSIIDAPIDFNTQNFPIDRPLKSNLFERFNSKEFYAYGSAYYVFPFLQLFLFLPVILVRYKRPNFNFAIGRLISIWVVFPLVVFLSFSNGRIFHLFGLL